MRFAPTRPPEPPRAAAPHAALPLGHFSPWGGARLQPVGMPRLPSRPQPPLDGQALRGKFFRGGAMLLPPRPEAAAAGGDGGSGVPIRPLYSHPINLASPQRKQGQVSPRLKPMHTSISHAAAAATAAAATALPPPSFDTDARNIEFLRTLLSVVPGGDLSTVAESQQQPSPPIVLGTGPEDEVQSLLSIARASPRKGKVYSRSETKMLESTIQALMARSRQAVGSMRQALAKQATDPRSTPHWIPVPTPPPPRDSESAGNGIERLLKRDALRIDEAARARRQRAKSNQRNNSGGEKWWEHGPRGGAKCNSGPENRRRSTGSKARAHHLQRPGSAASVTILETALAVSRESKAWDIVFAECVRQVHNNCKERGQLLNAIRMRTTQTNELLTNIVAAQQQMLNSFQKRQTHMRPRTRTVERKYRRAKREKEVNALTEAIRDHQSKLDTVRSRLQGLGNSLLPGSSNNADQAAFDAELQESRAHEEYERSKLAFRGLLSDLSRIERDGARFRAIVSGDSAADEAAREALELHRDFVADRVRRGQKLQAAALLMQAHWRGYWARKTEVVAARKLLRLRRLKEAGLREIERQNLARLRVARWLQRLHGIFVMRENLHHVIEDERATKRLLRLRSKTNHAQYRRNLHWIHYLQAANLLQKHARRYIWTKASWRNRWMRRVRKEAEDELLSRISDDETREQMRRTIALSLQEQEQNFFTKLHEMRDEMQYLERKIEKSETLADGVREASASAIAKVKTECADRVEEIETECLKKLRQKDAELHRLQHALARTKTRTVHAARKRNLGAETGAEYTVAALAERVEQLGNLKIPSLLVPQNQSHGGDFLSPNSQAGLADIEAATAKMLLVRRELARFAAQTEDIRGEIATRVENVRSVFREQDQERKVLVAYIEELEKELHTFDPGYVNKYGAKRLEEKANGKSEQKETAGTRETSGAGSRLRKGAMKGVAGRRHSMTSMKCAAKAATQLQEQYHNTHIRNGASATETMMLGTVLPKSGRPRRPSVVRADKTTGLF